MKVMREAGFFPVREFSSVREMVAQTIQRYPNEAAFRFRYKPQNEVIERSYRDLRDDVTDLACALLKIRQHWQNMYGHPSATAIPEDAPAGLYTALANRDLPVSPSELNIPDAPATAAAYACELTKDPRMNCLRPEVFRCVVVGSNSYAWCLAWLATVFTDNLVVPLDCQLPEEELQRLVQRSRPALLFYEGRMDPMMQRIAASCPSVRYLVPFDEWFETVGVRPAKKRRTSYLPVVRTKPPYEPEIHVEDLTISPTFPGDAPDAAEAAVQIWQQPISYLLARGAELHDEFDPWNIPLHVDLPCSLMYTSGTTDMSKAVIATQSNICYEVAGLTRVVKFKPSLASLSLLPIHHVFENICGFMVVMFFGGSININDGLRYIPANLKEYKINLLISVPLVFNHFYARIKAAIKESGKEKLVKKMIRISEGLRRVKIDLRRLFFRSILKGMGGKLRIGICGAAPADPEMITFFDQIGVRVLQGYGMTETMSVISGCNLRFFRPGTVGHPVAGLEVAVEADEYETDGEILVRGGLVFPGYLRDDGSIDRTAFTEDNWFRTGDVGRVSEQDESMTITGRVKSMIVLSSGKKVFPEEIEYVFSNYPLIRDSMVWGEPEGDDVQIAANLVLNRDEVEKELGKTATPDDIKGYLDRIIREINSLMPSFKTIKYYVYTFQDMIQTTTRKVKRNVEIERIRSFLSEKSSRLRDMTGRLLDELSDPAQSETQD